MDPTFVAGSPNGRAESHLGSGITCDQLARHGVHRPLAAPETTWRQ